MVLSLPVELWAVRSNTALKKCVHRYIDDCVTREEAVAMLEASLPLRSSREAEILADGFPAYTTQVGWLGYPDDKVPFLKTLAL
jgi:L-fuconate dehydratase